MRVIIQFSQEAKDEISTSFAHWAQYMPADDAMLYLACVVAVVVAIGIYQCWRF